MSSFRGEHYRRLEVGERLTIVGSDIYGSYWLRPGENREGEDTDGKDPLEVLTEALAWLKSLGERNPDSLDSS